MTHNDPHELFILIRDFGGMTRLAGDLSPDNRNALSRDLAGRIVDAGARARRRVRVVTANSEVVDWCRGRGVDTIADPGRGLDAAASAAVEAAGPRRWAVSHADLPFVDEPALTAALDRGTTVLVPSIDGGTNLIAGSGQFPFSFGTGSFHRHLAASPTAAVVTDPRLALDLDTMRQLAAVRRLAPTLIPS